MTPSLANRSALPAHLTPLAEVKPESCSQCLGWSESLEKVERLLGGDLSACGGCAHHNDMRIVAQQFAMNQPRWWAVNGRQVVPIWLVDRIRKKFHFRGQPA